MARCSLARLLDRRVDPAGQIGRQLQLPIFVGQIGRAERHLVLGDDLFHLFFGERLRSPSERFRTSDPEAAGNYRRLTGRGGRAAGQAPHRPPPPKSEPPATLNLSPTQAVASAAGHARAPSSGSAAARSSRGSAARAARRRALLTRSAAERAQRGQHAHCRARGRTRRRWPSSACRCTARSAAPAAALSACATAFGRVARPRARCTRS